MTFHSFNFVDQNEETVTTLFDFFQSLIEYDIPMLGPHMKNLADMTLEFIADETLKDSIKTEYAAEVFNLIIDYAHKFFVRGKKLPAIPAQFSKDTKETKAANDKFGVWFDENLEVAVDGKVPEKKILYELNLNNIHLTEKELRKRMKDKGFVYNSDLSGMGINDQTGKHHKGGYEGVKEV